MAVPLSRTVRYLAQEPATRSPPALARHCRLEGFIDLLPTPVTGKPTPCRCRSPGALIGATQARAPILRVPPRSARSSGAGLTIYRIFRPSAPSTPCSIGTGWSAAAVAAAHATRPKGTALSVPTAPERSVVRRLQGRVHAGRSALLLSAPRRSATSPAATCCAAMPSPAPRCATPSPSSSAPSRTSACRVHTRTDNGAPFASTSAFFGLSKLSVWWLRLGIAIERIRPGHPQQNGRHGTHAPRR